MTEQIFSSVTVDAILHKRLCGQCFGILSKELLYDDEGQPIKNRAGSWMFVVFCANCGEDMGLISKTYAEANADRIASGVKKTRKQLIKIGIIKDDKSSKSVDDLLQELGL